MPLGAVLGSIFERPGVSRRGPGGVPGRPGGVPGRLWRPLEDPLELLKMLGPQKGGLLGVYGSLLEASWSALGCLFGASWIVLEASWAPKGRPEGPKRVQNRFVFGIVFGIYLGPCWAAQNHENSYWRLGGQRIFTKSPVSFWGPFLGRFWDPKSI